jgi:ubiquinone/menaquinone biosynthesis C-methylase UbiE
MQETEARNGPPYLQPVQLMAAVGRLMSRGQAVTSGLSRMPTVRHPIFARCYERLSRVMERQVGEHRKELLVGLSGRVVEIGAGNGLNFPHYPSAVEEVVALEPEGYLRQKAEQAAHNAPVPVSVGNAAAYPLPLAAASVDAAVASLVLCTVPDPPSALAELRRVLKPGAELRFMEHAALRPSAQGAATRAA